MKLKSDKKRLGIVPIKNVSGFNEPTDANIRKLKRSEYFVVKGYSITGEAPKEFVRVHIPGESWKTKPKKWPLFIAKTGQKWYPAESIVEQINTRIGQELGLKMADTYLAIANTQIRFLSRYFLKDDEELVHGANIYRGYLLDEMFVTEVEKNREEVNFFTVSLTFDALEHLFPNEFENIFRDFIKMLLLDAFIGCNDRHMYNWGVIRSLYGTKSPIFAPIYDTARSLFWNISEEHLKLVRADKKSFNNFLQKYCINSKAKIGIEGKGQVNHFDLVICLIEKRFISKSEVEEFFSEHNYSRVIDVIKKEFGIFFSDLRLAFIFDYLKMRHKIITEKLKGYE